MPLKETTEFVFAFGWSQSFYVEALIWLAEDIRRRVVFITEKEVSHPQIRCYPLDSPIQIEPLAKKIAWQAVFKEMEIFLLEDGGEDFRKELLRCRDGADLALSEASDFGVRAFQNAKANAKAPLFDYRSLKGAFANVPAIIVGAGPSLQKTKHLLPKLLPKALILVGGSALAALDFAPHFAAGIDAEGPNGVINFELLKNTPFCCKARTDSRQLHLMQGPKILFPDASWPLLNRLFHIEGEFDSGWTVANFLTSLALFLGCKEILTTGVDFHYAGDQKYSHMEQPLGKGLVRNEKGQWTQRDWQMASRWMQEKGPFRPLDETFDAPSRDLKMPQLTLLPPPKEFVIDEDLLMPLWHVWKAVFEREAEMDPAPFSFEEKMKVHQDLFFAQVRKEHGYDR